MNDSTGGSSSVTLYPPIIDTYMKAFIMPSEAPAVTSTVIEKVYFAISNYNTESEIGNVHVTLVNQSNNLNALNTTKYPNGIALKALKKDTSIKTSDKYYIELAYEDFADPLFDTYYKVQLRFGDSNSSIDLTQSVQDLSNYLNDSNNVFSEWSSICLIRGISQPIVNISNLTEGETVQLYYSQTNFVGNLKFEEEDENECLKSYKFLLYQLTDPDIYELVYESDVLKSNAFSNINCFSYNLPYVLSPSIDYKLIFKYTTDNLYEGQSDFGFKIITLDTDNIDFIFKNKIDYENGKIDLLVEKVNREESFTGSILIRRSSSKDGYAIWETMHTEDVENAIALKFNWSDYTIEPGVLYNYCLQTVSSETQVYSDMIRFTEPILCDFEDIFIADAERQLAVRYEPSISNFKKVIPDTKIETIGSKYPFIIRNGQVNYTQFSVSGYIHSYGDFDNLFYSKEEEYGNNLKFVNKYYKEKSATNDWLYEDAYRKQVIDFLYDDSPKILRSPIEGCYLVRLMDISFSPDKVSGRKYWTFTANAVEIGEYTPEKMEELGLLNNRLAGTTIDYVQGEEQSV